MYFNDQINFKEHFQPLKQMSNLTHFLYLFIIVKKTSLDLN
jgi:hypothetical protein